MIRKACYSKLSQTLLLLSVVISTGCTSVQKVPSITSEQAGVNGCNVVAHAMCVYQTGKETLSDGLEGKWTRHWGRMSYIGQACEKEYGPVTGFIIEAIFAIPHYCAIAFGNFIAFLAYPFTLETEPDDSSLIDDESLIDPMPDTPRKEELSPE